jgi:hypothetical protein
MRLSLMLALTGGLLGGCIVQGPDEVESSQSVQTHNRLALNRLALNHLAATTLASDRLSTAKIADKNYAINEDSAAGLLATDEGQEVLTFIIGCALPAGQQLTVASQPTLIFTGEIGLAASWVDHPMNTDQQEWVSACLFSRVNAVDVAVDLSLRGSNPALATTPDEAAAFTLDEGAFYGQYFGDGAIEFYACSGADNAEAFARNRECATPDPAHPGQTYCTFTYTGTCGADRHPYRKNGGACQSASGGTYGNCLGQSAAPTTARGNGHSAESFSQVITSYLNPSQ